MVNVGLGFCTALASWLLGVENAALWVVAFAILSYMPLIGAAIMAIITLGVGIVSFADPIVAFAPLAVILGHNAIEGQVVTPMVVGARVRLPSIAVFFAIAFGGWMWGVAGALVATPALIVAVAFLRRLTAAPHSQSETARQ
jgi:predicted PurR-regulated permease PerM